MIIFIKRRFPIKALLLYIISISSINVIAGAPFDENYNHIGTTNNKAYRAYKWGNKLVTQPDNSTKWFGSHVGQDYSEGVPSSIGFGKISKLTQLGAYPAPLDFINCSTTPDCGLGNSVIVRYMNNFGDYVYALYGHLDSINQSIALNKFVVSQQPIGVMGKTGSGAGNVVHLHFELKSNNDLGTGRSSPTGWGYVPHGATSSTPIIDPDIYGYTNPNGYITNNSNTISLPYLSHVNPYPNIQNYSVYGIESNPINAQIALNGNFQRSSILVRSTGDRQRSETADALDNEHKFMGGTHDSLFVSGIVGTQSYPAGDYLFLAYAKRDNQDRFGYPVKFTFVKSGSIVVDNDQMNADDNTLNDSTIDSVYNGSLGNKVPGYYLTASLFAGRSNSFAQWKPNSANTYKIFVHVPEYGATATTVRYKIKADGSTTLISKPIDQKSHPNEWVQLVGSDNSTTFSFNKLGMVGLSLSSDSADQNFGISDSETVAFDAIKFEKVSNGNAEVDTLLNASHETSWAYFRDYKQSNSTSIWFISDTSGITYGLGRNSVNHAAWISIGGENPIATVDFLTKKVSVLSNSNTSSQSYNAVSLVGGEGAMTMYSSLAFQWSKLIEGYVLPIDWYFFKVSGTQKWYIVNTAGLDTVVLGLGLTSDKSQYAWQIPVDAAGQNVDVSGWKKVFVKNSSGQWTVSFAK